MSQYTISHSAEFMRNYQAGEVLNPEAKFQATQTSAGTALLFSLGTDGSFYLTQEKPSTETGWIRVNLSQTQADTDFPGLHDLICTEFAVAKKNSPLPTIRLAMVLGNMTQSALYLSMGMPADAPSWADVPWEAYPFDDPDHHLNVVKIVNVFLSTAADGDYVVVDVLRDPSSALHLISRYYIDINKSGGYAWHAHDVAIDIEENDYTSCMGRNQPGGPDGIYTSGKVTGSSQLQYQPLFNQFNTKIPASPSLLHLPFNLTPDTIAVCQTSDNTTDLYAVAQGKLYYFASTNQKSDAQGVRIVEHALLSGMRHLFVDVQDGRVIVWGLNGNNEIVYTTGRPPRETNQVSSWSIPVVICASVEQVSPYIDYANSANTFFAHIGENQLIKAVQSPHTTLWTFQPITLAPLPNTTNQTMAFPTYTTRIQVLAPNGQPAAATAIHIQADNVVPMYINGLYYIVGSTPIQVATDGVGTVTMVERVSGMAGTRMTVSCGDMELTVNPMDSAFRRAMALNSADALRQAQIAFPNGDHRPLLPAGVSDREVEAVATSNCQLAKAYWGVNQPRTQAVHGLSLAEISRSGVDAIWVAAGDLFAWLASGVKYVVRLVESVATNTWYFLATLGDKTYGCILDCVETVVAAAQWVYMAINTAIEDLLQYLTFLFDWSDITRTKNVIKNLITVFLQNELQQIDKTRVEIDQKFAKADKFLSDLINEDWTRLGDVGRSTANKTALPTANNSAPGSLLSYPFGLHAQNTKILPSIPTDTPIPAGNSLTEFQQAIFHEKTALNDLATQMTKLGTTAGELSLESLLKSLMTLAVEATLHSIQSIVDKVLNMLKDIACVGMNLLDQPVHIPVVSDILADFGVQSMSLLDVACWMTAIPITVGYKMTHRGNAPFPDTAVTTFLAETTDFAILENMFRPSNPREKILEPNGEDYKAGILLAMPGELPSISDEVRHVLFIVGHEVSGLASLMTTLVGTFEALAETANPWSIPSAVLAVMGGGAAGVVTALVPYAPLTQPIMAWISKATTGIRLLSKVGFAGLEKYGVEFDTRAAGALVDAALVIPALIVSGWHFAELAPLSTDDARTIAIVDETSVLTTALARASYAVAVNSEAIVKVGAVGVFAVTNLLTGGLQTAEGILTQP